jgi:hypothetical protein
MSAGWLFESIHALFKLLLAQFDVACGFQLVFTRIYYIYTRFWQ